MRLRASRWDYPRTCGEHQSTVTTTALTQGLPPHLRGTLQRAAHDVKIARITPAPAGNTLTAFRFVGVRRDYPRTCGEHYQTCFSKPRSVGLPPHLRGTLSTALRLLGTTRITPAPAGNTLMAYVFCVSVRDYPRTCGEHSGCSSKSMLSSGLPPHLRGTLGRLSLMYLPDRITPAPAGNTPIST